MSDPKLQRGWDLLHPNPTVGFERELSFWEGKGAEVIVTWGRNLGRAMVMKIRRQPKNSRGLALYTAKMDTSHRCAGSGGKGSWPRSLLTQLRQEGLTWPLDHQKEKGKGPINSEQGFPNHRTSFQFPASKRKILNKLFNHYLLIYKRLIVKTKIQQMHLKNLAQSLIKSEHTINELLTPLTHFDDMCIGACLSP